MLGPGEFSGPGVWRLLPPAHWPGSLADLPGEWVRVEPDGWTQMVVCLRCGARWLTHLGAFSDRTRDRLYAHGRDHLRGTQAVLPPEASDGLTA